MARRRRGLPIDGWLAIDKPEGMSSAQAVAAVKRLTGAAKVGHAGTLDPLATGVLVLALGRATKSIDLVMATSKRYRTVIDLTAFTTTDDREGDRTEVEVETPPGAAEVGEALDRFRGEVMQCTVPICFER